MKDKRGVTMSGWTEGILLAVLVVLILVMVVGDMNVKYNKDNEIGLGTESTLSAFEQYQDTVNTNVNTGESGFQQDGLTLSSTWGMITGGSNILWSFVTGGWISTITVEYLGLPTEVAFIFRILYFLSIGFIILRLLLKIIP